MQPQFAAFIGTVTQGDLADRRDGALYVEMSPGNEVLRMVDIAVKATEARPERRSSNASWHVRSPSLNQAAVLEAGEVVLKRLDLAWPTAQAAGRIHTSDHTH